MTVPHSIEFLMVLYRMFKSPDISFYNQTTNILKTTPRPVLIKKLVFMMLSVIFSNSGTTTGTNSTTSVFILRHDNLYRTTPFN